MKLISFLKHSCKIRFLKNISYEDKKNISTLTLSLQHTVYVRDSSYISNRNFNAFSNNSRQFKITAKKLRPKIESDLKNNQMLSGYFLVKQYFWNIFSDPNGAALRTNV